ncbi:MAG: hypothetical protein ACLUEK_03865 [Oscillospiraceae bacterium]
MHKHGHRHMMLCAIFAMVFSLFTRANLERESIGMMQALAQEPMRPAGRTSVRRACVCHFHAGADEDGGIADAWGGYYDLTDGELLEKLPPWPRPGTGTPACWRTTACAIAGSVARDAVHRLCGHVQRAERHR